jgi:hypothetical protein
MRLERVVGWASQIPERLEWDAERARSRRIPPVASPVMTTMGMRRFGLNAIDFLWFFGSDEG